jgi:hypothetical protein
MEEARKLDLRPVLAVAAILAVAVTLWASGAFAAGGGSSSSDPATPDPAAAFVQQGDQATPPGDDCPEHEGNGSGGGGGSGGGSGSNDSGAGDL